MNYGYDPLQSRRDMLLQQRQMIENQLNSLNQMNNLPPININNNMSTPSQLQNYDGNFKWVDNEEQAKQIANNNLPLILFDNNQPIFYMKNTDGSFKKFQFSEVKISQPNDDNQLRKEIDIMNEKINNIIDVLNKSSQNNTRNEKAPQQKSIERRASK